MALCGMAGENMVYVIDYSILIKHLNIIIYFNMMTVTCMFQNGLHRVTGVIFVFFMVGSVVAFS